MPRVVCDNLRQCGLAGESARSPILVFEVTRLEWEVAAAGNPELDGCPINGGRRIFPGLTNPGDGDFAADRRKVNLVATVHPPVAGIGVHFRVWDVDDPFDQIYGPQGVNTVREVELIDNDESGPDNRMPSGQPDPAVGVYYADTDENGRAVVPIEVSMQPGNNYRAGASCLEDAIGEDQVTQTHADEFSSFPDGDPPDFYPGPYGGSFYSVPLVWSEMLTVWRKLHVEFDSMTSEPTDPMEREPDWFGVYVTGGTANATTTTLDLGVFSQGASEHQYEGGSLIFQALGLEYSVWNNARSTVDIDVVLTAAEINALVGHWAVERDDDPIEPLLPHFYTVDDFIRNAFADAYIVPVDVETQFNPDTLVDFDLYLSADELSTGNGWNNGKNVDSSEQYWVSLVVSGYQHGADLFLGEHDGDPDPWVDNTLEAEGPVHTPLEEYEEGCVVGVTAPLLFDLGDWDTVLFLGTIAEAPHWAHYDSQVISHEIGHSAGNAGTPEEHHLEWGLMRSPLQIQDHTFWGKTLKRFRESEKW